MHQPDPENETDFDISSIVGWYETCLKEHGPTAKGVDWPDREHMEARFRVMLGIIEAGLKRPVLLDLGCGPGLMVDYLEKTGRLANIEYHGLDISEKMIAAARARRPDCDFVRRDPLAEPLPDKSVDYVIMNGVLTEKRDLDQDSMTEYAQALITAAFRVAKQGIAFNVMGRNVDKKRKYLFHWPMTEMADFLEKQISSDYAVRDEYDDFEITVYVRR